MDNLNLVVALTWITVNCVVIIDPEMSAQILIFLKLACCSAVLP